MIDKQVIFSLKDLFIEKCENGEIKTHSVPYVGCGSPYVKKVSYIMYDISISAFRHIDRIAYDKVKDEFYIHFSSDYDNKWSIMDECDMTLEEQVAFLCKALNVKVKIKIIPK